MKQGAQRSLSFLCSRQSLFASFCFTRVRRLAQVNVAYDLELESFERRDFWRMVRQQQDAPQAKVVKDLCSDAVVSIQSVAGFDARFLLAEAALLHQRVGAQLMHQIETVLALPQIENHSPSGAGDLFQRRMKLKSRVVDE